MARTSTYRQLLRFFVSIALAIGLYTLVRHELTILAFGLVLVSKWQVFLGGPRLWLHNIWDNAVDILFAFFSVTLLALYGGDVTMQLAVTALYLGWQVLLKPLTGVIGHSVQAAVLLAVAITAIFILKPIIGMIGMILLSVIVSLAAAEHFLVSVTDDTALRRLLVSVWALITVQIVWIFGRWLVFYPFLEGRILLPQATLVVLALGYAFGMIYYDHHRHQLGRKRLFGYIGLIGLITVILIMGSEWVSQL